MAEKIRNAYSNPKKANRKEISYRKRVRTGRKTQELALYHNIKKGRPKKTQKGLA